jgi:hypothetical protein
MFLYTTYTLQMYNTGQPAIFTATPGVGARWFLCLCIIHSSIYGSPAPGERRGIAIERQG